MLRRPFFWIIALVIAAFAIAPALANDVELRESLLLAAVYITLASNLNLMLGYAGYVNFGSIVFFGLGGYICVYLMGAPGWPLVAALLAAGVAVSLLGADFRPRHPAPARRLFRARDDRRQRGGAGLRRQFPTLGRLVGPLSSGRACSRPWAGRCRRCGSSISSSSR